MSTERHKAGPGPAAKQPPLESAPIQVHRSIDAKTRRNDPGPAAFSARAGQANTSHLSGQVLSLVVLVVGLAAGLATYSVNRLNVTDPEAVAPLILDENEVHWPFFRASHDLADAILSNPSVLQEAAAVLPNPDDAISLRVDPSSDLSVLQLVATANTSEAAETLAASGALVLIRHSEADRRQRMSDDLVPLQAAIGDLEPEQRTIEAELLSATDESAQIRLRSDLRSVSDLLNARRTELEDLEKEIQSTGSAYIFLDPAQVRSPSRQSWVASLAAGAGAAVLTLLLLSFVTARPRDD